MSDETHSLLQLSRELLRCIDRQDWEAYARLCDPTLTAFEPEAVGHLIEGLDFHQFYFPKQTPGNTTGDIGKLSSISSPHVRLMGDTAVVSYIRLVQRRSEGNFTTAAVEETRVWERQAGQWKHVHFHRSRPTPLEG